MKTRIEFPLVLTIIFIIITNKSVSLSLRANWQQFTLLTIISPFVGIMVGLERTVLPLIAEADFGLVSKSVVMPFLIGFGVIKALANLFAGRHSDRLGYRRLSGKRV